MTTDIWHEKVCNKEIITTILQAFEALLAIDCPDNFVTIFFAV